MKKGGTIPGEKNTDPKGVIKSLSEIKFNLSAHTLACFKSKELPPLGKSKTDCLK